MLAAEDIPRFLAETPVALLGHLHAVGTFSPELLARLAAYGLSTLRHVARLSDATLGHQFGPAGQFLARLVRGEALQALRPTPAPRCHTLALRIPGEALPLARVTARLPVLMARLGAWLTRTGYTVGEVRLRLGWISGGEQCARQLLKAPSSDPALLAREAERLLTHIIILRQASPEDLVSVCQLTVARSAPALPAQQVLWASPPGRHGVVAQLAKVLHARHGKALLTQVIATSPAAIFDERRFRLLPYAQSARTPNVASLRVRAVGDWDEVPQRLHWW
jgi:hypothetical protein